jgi:hypothetical protein
MDGSRVLERGTMVCPEVLDLEAVVGVATV